MSYWTYITGVITVKPMGRTQPEKRYVLDTILEHLPKVTGSERNMDIRVAQVKGYSSSDSYNEFGEPIRSRTSKRYSAPYDKGLQQDEYTVLLTAKLRDRVFEETLHELNRFLNRLAKRVAVNDILIKLNDGWSKSIIISDSKPYEEMMEGPSWYNDEIAWCEYLMWDSAKDSDYPMKLMYKYYDDPENDEEVERRMDYGKEKIK